MLCRFVNPAQFGLGSTERRCQRKSSLQLWNGGSNSECPSTILMMSREDRTIRKVLAWPWIWNWHGSMYHLSSFRWWCQRSGFSPYRALPHRQDNKQQSRPFPVRSHVSRCYAKSLYPRHLPWHCVFGEAQKLLAAGLAHDTSGQWSRAVKAVILSMEKALVDKVRYCSLHLTITPKDVKYSSYAFSFRSTHVARRILW